MSAYDKESCVVCEKKAEGSDKFHPFIVAVARGVHPITREPMVRDGIFDDNGKLALLKACPSCAPKVKAVLRDGDIKHLPKGLFRTLYQQILRREKRRGRNGHITLH